MWLKQRQKSSQNNEPKRLHLKRGRTEWPFVAIKVSVRKVNVREPPREFVHSQKQMAETIISNGKRSYLLDIQFQDGKGKNTIFDDGINYYFCNIRTLTMIPSDLVISK